MARLYYDKRTGWWIGDFRDSDGSRQRCRMGRTKAAAEAVLRKALDRVDQERGHGKIRDVRFSDVSKTFVEWVKAHRKPLTGEFYEDHLNTLQEILENPMLSQISRKTVDGLVATLKEKGAPKKGRKKRRGAKPATINRYLACLKRLFNKAMEWNHALSNPVKGVRMLREDNSRVRYLDDKERKTLMDACPDWLRDIVEVDILTGLRRSELFGLTWKDVDLARGQLAVRETKNGETRYLPIPSHLRTVFLRVAREVGNPYVFARPDGKRPVNFRKAWDQAVRRSGLKDFRLHDLRHTFASYFVMSGGDLPTLKELLGHKTLSMTLRYAHLAPGYKRDMMERMAEKIASGIVKPVEDGTQMAQASA